MRLGGPARAVRAGERPQRDQHPLHVGRDVVDRRAVIALSGFPVHGQELAEVVQRAERVAGQLVETPRYAHAG